VAEIGHWAQVASSVRVVVFFWGRFPMAIRSSWCPVLQSHVTRVTDLEGSVAAVFCSEYQKATRTCRMKREALDCGPLSQFMRLASENSLADSLARCPMW
jgi:hypothetical protein